MLLTDGHTRVAGDASMSRDGGFGPGGETLRVVAPQAAQGAALQEYRGPDSRPIVKAETLNVEDRGGDHGSAPVCSSGSAAISAGGISTGGT